MNPALAADAVAEVEPLPVENSVAEPALAQFADVPLTVAFELARTTITTAELLALAPGSLIDLGAVDIDSVRVLVESDPIGSGEVTLCQETYGVRITSLGDVSSGEST